MKRELPTFDSEISGKRGCGDAYQTSSGRFHQPSELNTSQVLKERSTNDCKTMPIPPIPAALPLKSAYRQREFSEFCSLGSQTSGPPRRSDTSGKRKTPVHNAQTHRRFSTALKRCRNEMAVSEMGCAAAAGRSSFKQHTLRPERPSRGR